MCGQLNPTSPSVSTARRCVGPNTSLREMAVVVQVHAGSWAKCRAVPEDKAQAKLATKGL